MFSGVFLEQGELGIEDLFFLHIRRRMEAGELRGPPLKSCIWPCDHGSVPGLDLLSLDLTPSPVDSVNRRNSGLARSSLSQSQQLPLVNAAKKVGALLTLEENSGNSFLSVN